MDKDIRIVCQKPFGEGIAGHSLVKVISSFHSSSRMICVLSYIFIVIYKLFAIYLFLHKM